jgi:Arc/MetJ-type ribon-helix-helix transcriptional regulator
MKMSERIQRNMQADKPMTLISLRLPDHVIEDLKEVAPSLRFGGYQALIRAYISNGLRKHLAEREALRVKDSAVEEFSRRLMARGVPEQTIQEAAAEMRAGS